MMSERQATKADLSALGKAMKAGLDEAVGSVRRDLDTKAAKTDLSKMATKVDLAELGEALKADLDAAIGSVRRDLDTKATKADLADLGKAIRSEMATKTELSDLREEMKSEFKVVRGEIGGVRRGLALQIERLQSDLRASEGRVMQEMGALNSKVVGRLEIFAGRMETIWRESMSLPRVIDEQGRTLGDHEVRIKSLEGRTS